MKKILLFLIIFIFFITLLFCGCGEKGRNNNEKRWDDRGGLIGTCDDFLGIWQDERGSGGFGIGDTLKFNTENNCTNSTYEQYWSHGGATHHYGIWERTKNSTNNEDIIILKMGQKETVYYFNFFDNYTTLRLREEKSEDYIFYYKRS